MRNIFAVSVLIFATFSISSTSNKHFTNTSKSIIKKYLEYSPYTNPGEFEYLYNNLPESIEGICDVIKNQLIHPFDLKKYGNKIPENRIYEDRSVPSVEQMLKELMKRDEKGLVLSRQPEDRLVVACVHHCMLLASILRHKGIPTRMRAGNAKYIGDDHRIRVSHVICEVWEKQSGEWVLVDPDRYKIKFDRQEFEFASETWDKVRKDEINKKFYVSRYKSIDQAAAHLLCLDLSYVVGIEESYWKDPPIVVKIENSVSDIMPEELQLLDKIARLLIHPDDNIDELNHIKRNHQSLDNDG